MALLHSRPRNTSTPEVFLTAEGPGASAARSSASIFGPILSAFINQDPYENIPDGRLLQVTHVLNNLLEYTLRHPFRVTILFVKMKKHG